MARAIRKYLFQTNLAGGGGGLKRDERAYLRGGLGLFTTEDGLVHHKELECKVEKVRNITRSWRSVQPRIKTKPKPSPGE